MDTVDLVLLALLTLLLSTIGTAILAWRWRRAALSAQREVLRLVAQQHAAGYDTGLMERPIIQVLDAS
jgi:sensor histidine kinase regulating citrate/malate metabolism